SLPLAELPLLTGPERQVLLYEGNDTAIADQGGDSFEELFEARTAETPSAPAAACDGLSQTYAELSARANRLAWHLLGMGVEPGTVVALVGRVGPDLWTAIVGVQKAGGAWLPLDPEHPAHRHAQVLSASATPLV